MWPARSDEELLDELSVVVTTGWELPNRPHRQHAVRHLLLLVGPADSLSYSQAAQRLLLLLDSTLRDADDDVLGEDDRTGCRILLGVHPTYRSVASPTRRRQESADFLVADWQSAAPSDPAGTFQRRHQPAALRQILECLWQRYGHDDDPDEEYDVARIQRWYHVGANRQITACGDTTDYRVLRDGLDAIELLETAPDSEGLLSSEFSVEPVGEEPQPAVESVEDDPTRPGYRRISIGLRRNYEAGELLRLAWREDLRFGDDPPDWGRSWVTVGALNDGFELEVSVAFGDDAELPDLCWWFSAEPGVDLNEIGPSSLDQVIDLNEVRFASQAWQAAGTERRRLYGFIWVWLDDAEDRQEWGRSRARLLDQPYAG